MQVPNKILTKLENTIGKYQLSPFQLRMIRNDSKKYIFCTKHSLEKLIKFIIAIRLSKSLTMANSLQLLRCLLALNAVNKSTVHDSSTDEIYLVQRICAAQLTFSSSLLPVIFGLSLSAQKLKLVNDIILLTVFCTRFPF
jgi:hypothetical protein